MIDPRTVVIVAGLGLGLWGFHEYTARQQQIGYDRAKGEYERAELVRDAAQSKLDAFLNKRVSDAESKATEREQAQKTISAATGASLDRLRNTVNQTVAGSNTATLEALRATTATLGTVFQDCAGRYRKMAENADGHANDVRTLSDAWPVAPPGSGPGKE